MREVDVLVLGAGIVGVSAALHLQRRGRSVALVDRGGPGEGTSFGNAGLIELSNVAPHPMPADPFTLLRFALNRHPALRYAPAFLPRIAPWLARYRHFSRGPALDAVGSAYRALTHHALAEHEALAAGSGAGGRIRRTGWLELHRSAPSLDCADREAEAARRLGIAAHRLSGVEVAAREPGLRLAFAGGLHWADSASVADPGGLVRVHAEQFVRDGGQVVRADALALARREAGWALPKAGLTARQVVVALGPWSADLTGRLGEPFPLLAKRGYHQEVALAPGAALDGPVYWAEAACLVVPTPSGVRVLSGVELAPRDSAPSPVQIDRMVRAARTLLPLGEPLTSTPWLGARPCLPDMLPVIGPSTRHPGLWFAFGHGHAGLTLGPVTGRLLAEMMTGEVPFVSPAPYRAGRFDREAPAPARVAEGSTQAGAIP